MAALETWTSYFQNIALAASKNMGAILNTDATAVRQIRRAGLLNAQTAAVTGVLCQIEWRVYQTGSPGLTAPTAVTPTPHDTTNSLAAGLTSAHAGTIAGTALTLRRVFWSSDEAAISSATNDELEAFVPLNIIWDAGYYNTDVQPLTLRQNQMGLAFNTVGAAGVLDTWIEFTES